MLNEIQNNSLSFKASVPNTIGKKNCDKLARYLLKKQYSPESVELANRYFQSIEKLKEDKNFDEIIISASNRVFMNYPTVLCDGEKMINLSPDRIEEMPEEIYKKFRKNLQSKYRVAYKLMQKTISVADYSKPLKDKFNTYG